jgi:hypothetical protein
MKTLIVLALVSFAGLILQDFLVPAAVGAGYAEAAQTKTKKQQATKKKTTTSTKKSYCGYPQPPIPAGMSDYCALQYDLYCRRGVGCNIYGR